MTPARQISDLSRQELYELVWSTPATTLAANFSISNVAIAKHCMRQNVPRPSRGYWAKLAAGKNATKTPLPPPADEVFAKAAGQGVEKVVSLPTSEPLHELATAFKNALPKARLDSYRRACLCEPPWPETTVSKSLFERVSQSFHVILNGVEPLGICFRKSRRSYDGGHFQKGHDRLYLTIEESLAEPIAEGRRGRRRRWHWNADNRVPTGRLTFSLRAERYGARDSNQWVESDKVPLEQLLPKIIATIRRHYVDAQKRRAQDAIERERQRVESERMWREWQAKETIRIKQEAEKKHSAALASVAESRTADLRKAAGWWRWTREVMEFINECEERWKRSDLNLTQEQAAWVKWARAKAFEQSPFAGGYPDPANDGAFEPEAVPFGGPYPVTRNFPRPPGMS